MSLNSYQWELYLQSKGKETIEGFQKLLSGQVDGYPEYDAAVAKHRSIQRDHRNSRATS